MWHFWRCTYTKKVFEKYVSSPVLLSFDSIPVPISDIPFPSMTICNMNRVSDTEVPSIYSRKALSSATGNEVQSKGYRRGAGQRPDQ